MSCFFLGHLNRSRQIRSFSTWIDFFLQGKPFGDQKHTCCFGNKIHGPLPKKCFESSQLFRSLVYFGILFIMFLILFLRSCCSSSWKKNGVSVSVLFVAKFKAKLASIRWMNDHLGIICGVRCHHLAGGGFPTTHGPMGVLKPPEVSSNVETTSPKWFFFVVPLV